MDVKGFLIKKLKEENLTQTALARKLNLSQPFIRGLSTSQQEALLLFLKEIQHVSSINEK